VTVVGHEVSYDRERQAWYCDINLDVGQAYYPFIRLALVRYQPHSIPGAHLSPVTLADFVQTVPDRSVSVSRSLGQTSSYDVAVSGVSYQSRRPLQTAAETVSVTQMEISIQKRDPQIPDPDLGWSALSEEATSVALNPGPPDERGTVTWTGRIVAAGNQHPERLRLVVREFEQLDAAPGAQSLTRRLVFVDLIQLSF